MKINGFIYLFDVCVFNEDSGVKRIAVCSTVEEAVREAEKNRTALRANEYIDINPCEVSGFDCSDVPVLDSTCIDGFGTPWDNDQTIGE